MAEMSEVDWTTLIRNIAAHECTPFLGAGACCGILPLGREIAGRLSEDYGYPWKKSSGDLAKVAQFTAVKHGRNTMVRALKSEFVDGQGKSKSPNFDDPDEPHAVLAALPLPVYITTNYDDFMFQALKAVGKDPERDFCRWFTRDADRSVRQNVDKQMLEVPPSEECTDEDEDEDRWKRRPLVYHLHGIKGNSDSMVITEDDYTDFLVRIAEDIESIHKEVRAAVKNKSLLFLGYSLEDTDFRVVYQYIHRFHRSSSRPLSVAVQVASDPDDDADPKEQAARVRAATDYLGSYLEPSHIVTKWCSGREFAAELRARWEWYLHYHPAR
jgi:hypothetical protein